MYYLFLTNMRSTTQICGTLLCDVIGNSANEWYLSAAKQSLCFPGVSNTGSNQLSSNKPYCQHQPPCIA